MIKCVTVTWNVLGMFLERTIGLESGWVADKVVREAWEVVSLTEFRAEVEGRVCLSENACRIVFIQTVRSGVSVEG